MTIKKKKQFGVILLAGCLMAAPVQAHWAQTSIDRFAQMDMIQGYQGDYRPNDFITRGEFAVLMNRMLKYEGVAKNTYKDLGDTWYTQDMLKMAEAGVMLGDGKQLRPTDPITREEAAAIISRVFFLENKGKVQSFEDADAIAPWAVDSVNTMKAKGYMRGRTNGSFEPGEAITRAEIIKVLDEVVTKVYTKDGTYIEDVKGNLVVTAKEVVLKGGTITGNIIIGESSQKVELQHVDLKEKVVLGGGDIKIQGDVPHLLIQGEAKVEIEEGTIGYLEVAPEAQKSEVMLKKGASITKSSLPESYTLTKVKPQSQSGGGSSSSGSSSTSGSSNNGGSSSNAGSSNNSGSSNASSSNGSSNSSSTGSNGSVNTEVDTPQGVCQYTLEESFFMAPTSQVTLYQQGEKVCGYTLYAQGHKIAKDEDLDGVVIIPKGYSQQKLVVRLGNETQDREITLKETGDRR